MPPQKKKKVDAPKKTTSKKVASRKVASKRVASAKIAPVKTEPVKVKKKDNFLAMSILLGSVLVAIALIFFGFMLSGNLNDEEFQQKVEQGIELYIQKAQQDAAAADAQAQAPATVELSDFVDDDAVLGDPNAPVTIVEFSDYECPYCKRFFTDTLPQIKADYIDKGLVKIMYRDNPLSFHADAYPSALAAECVRDQLGDDAYFEMHDKMFSGNDLSLSTLEDYATEVGVNVDKYNQCITSEKFKDEIQADIDSAHSVNLTGTPSFIINGVVAEGAQPYEIFKQVIDTELGN